MSPQDIESLIRKIVREELAAMNKPKLLPANIIEFEKAVNAEDPKAIYEYHKKYEVPWGLI